MKITDIIKSEKPSLSFEVFPPKTWGAYNQVKNATEEIAALSPDFMSVTYGAGGGTSDYTVSIAENIEKNFGIPALAHLTCVTSTKTKTKQLLDSISDAGVKNILALRGDIPESFDRTGLEYRHASELTEEIRAYGGFCIGGACYPEGHPESLSSLEDIKYLKEKVKAGCEFFTTQMFFDNNVLYNFLYRIREADIDVPVIAGIMPVTNPSSIKRICQISGAALPQRFMRIVERYGSNPEAMKQAGIAFATDQIIDLYANGIRAVHVYSMNKPDVAAKIKANISEILV